LSRRPAAAAALTGAATALLARRLSRVTGERWPIPPVARTSSCAVDSGFRPANAHDNSHGPDETDNSKKRRGREGGPADGAAWRLAVRLAGGGTVAAARPLGSALSRTWWPVAIPAALAVKKLRVPVAALILVPPLLDWADRRPPLDPARYVAARLLDDAAYSLGVWQGCLARRTARPLLPLIGGKRQPRPEERRHHEGTEGNGPS
jgi:hypothetical protein